MDPARSRHASDIVTPLRPYIWARYGYRVSEPGGGSILALHRALKLDGLERGKVVPATDDVGSVRVVGRIQGGGEEGEHFCGMPAAAKDDEDADGGAARAGMRGGGVCAGEDVKEAELVRGEGWVRIAGMNKAMGAYCY